VSTVGGHRSRGYVRFVPSLVRNGADNVATPRGALWLLDVWVALLVRHVPVVEQGGRGPGSRQAVKVEACSDHKAAKQSVGAGL
jgi:hypothetical protein